MAEQRRSRTVRQRARDAIVEAARDLTVARGWDGVRMGDVAAAAGVSRQTVYNEFTNKAGLAEALARHEVERFVVGVRAALDAHGQDIRSALHAAIGHALTEAAGNPLIKAIVSSPRGGSEELLPYLTTHAELVLDTASDAVSDWVRQRLPGLDPPRVAGAVDSIVRLVVSHIVLPLAPVERTTAELTHLATLLITDAVDASRRRWPDGRQPTDGWNPTGGREAPANQDPTARRTPATGQNSAAGEDADGLNG